MENSKRYYLLDSIRGFSVISMVLFHAMWNMVYIYSINIPWYKSTLGTIWQKSICIVFILLAGFCYSFGKKKIPRSLILLVCSASITIFTKLFMPENIIHFGILCLLGSSIILILLLEKFLRKINCYSGLIISIVVFAITYSLELGYAEIPFILKIPVPDFLYKNLFTAFLGFPDESFISYDYYPIFPWFFLYICGYYMHKIFEKKSLLKFLCSPRIKAFEFIGNHALIIYIFHQPVIYIIQYLIFNR